MLKFEAERILDGLDELSTDNLRCEPPRITVHALLFAMKKSKYSHINCENIPSYDLIRLAEQLNDMIAAASVIQRSHINQMKEESNDQC